MDGVVPDANTLIYLAKSGMLSVLNQYEVYITETVYEESVEAGKERDKSDAYILEKHIEECTLEKVENGKLERQKEYFGAKGEASVYLLANEKDVPAVTSDKTARNKMKKKQVEVIRTDILLLKQFEKGLIDKSGLRERLNRLNSVGGTTGQRINFIIQKVEENPNRC